jgi:hypothetical protein
MGKVSYDPIIKSFRNRIGNFVYTQWKGKNVVRAYDPEKKRTFNDAQRKVQNAFAVVVSIWKNMPEIMKASWMASAAGKPLTEYNLFISRNVKKQKDGEPYQISCKMGLDRLPSLSVAPGVAGQVAVTLGQVPGDINLTIAIQKIIDGKGDDQLDLRFDQYKGSQPVTIDGLESGAEYFVYCVTTDKPFAEAAKISESAGFRVMVV